VFNKTKTVAPHYISFLGGDHVSSTTAAVSNLYRNAATHRYAPADAFVSVCVVRSRGVWITMIPVRHYQSTIRVDGHREWIGSA